jgi:hypothetical protein
MEAIALVVALIVGLYLIDRGLLWLEAQGFIYYRRKRSISSGCANALADVQAMFEPGMQDVIEARQKEDEEDDDDNGNRKKNPRDGTLAESKLSKNMDSLT